MSDRDELQALLKGAVKRGEFTLASGAKSDWYLDCREITFTYPLLVAKVCLGHRWNVPAYDTEKSLGLGSFNPLFAGVAIGGIPMATAMACHSHRPSIGIRTEAKDHGTKNYILGPAPAEWQQTIIIDDVFTTGGSLAKATDRYVEATALEPASYLTLFNRNADSQGRDEFLGKPFTSIFGLKDILG